MVTEYTEQEDYIFKETHRIINELEDLLNGEKPNLENDSEFTDLVSDYICTTIWVRDAYKHSCEHEYLLTLHTAINFIVGEYFTSGLYYRAREEGKKFLVSL
jgi:predicted metal-dependent enzyme (double-stranded beta helix superfamily)